MVYIHGVPTALYLLGDTGRCSASSDAQHSPHRKGSTQTTDSPTVALGKDAESTAALTALHRKQNSGPQPQSLAGQTLLYRWFQQLGLCLLKGKNQSTHIMSRAIHTFLSGMPGIPVFGFHPTE